MFHYEYLALEEEIKNRRHLVATGKMEKYELHKLEGEIGEKIFEEILLHDVRTNTISFFDERPTEYLFSPANARENGEMRKNDIDYVVIWNTNDGVKEIYHEVKRDAQCFIPYIRNNGTPGGETGNVFLETWGSENRNHNFEGWFIYSRADWFHFHLPTRQQILTEEQIKRWEETVSAQSGDSLLTRWPLDIMVSIKASDLRALIEELKQDNRFAEKEFRKNGQVISRGWTPSIKRILESHCYNWSNINFVPTYHMLYPEDRERERTIVIPDELIVAIQRTWEFDEVFQRENVSAREVAWHGKMPKKIIYKMMTGMFELETNWQDENLPPLLDEKGNIIIQRTKKLVSEREEELR